MENTARPLTLRQLFKNKIFRPITSLKKKWIERVETLRKYLFYNFFKIFFLPFPPFFFFSFFLFWFFDFLFLPFIILFSSSSRHSVGGDEQESEKIFPREKKNRMCKKWHAKEHSLSIAISLTTMINRNRHAPSCLARLFSFLSQLIS